MCSPWADPTLGRSWGDPCGSCRGPWGRHLDRPRRALPTQVQSQLLLVWSKIPGWGVMTTGGWCSRTRSTAIPISSTYSATRRSPRFSSKATWTFATLALETSVKKSKVNKDAIFFSSDLQPAPSVGFNLTFVCPEGQVFQWTHPRNNINQSILFGNDSRFSITTGLRLRSSSQRANPTESLTLQTGELINASFVSFHSNM